VPRRRKTTGDPRARGMSRTSAGLIALVLIAVFSYFGFTKANPFADPYKVTAMFDDADDVKARAPVRIAGVDVGKVAEVVPVEGTQTGARVVIELEKRALPIHEDATLKVRPRIFLEGNKFVDMSPGSPSAGVLEDGGSIPASQTFGSVQFGDVLTALQSDTREDLQVLLKEYAKGLEGKGARGFNESIRYWESAYRNSSLANDATLGQEPSRDLQRVLRGQRRTFAALVEDEGALKGLVTNLNLTAGAFAREDQALERSLPALRDTLRAARPALGSLNGALPSLRRFAADALPGVRSTPETLDASTPFIRQARLLFRRSELRGAARQLRRHMPSLVRLNARTVPVLEEGRGLSACTNQVLVPFANAPIPFPELAGLDGQSFRRQGPRGLVGLSGESRLSDGNLSFFHSQLVPPPTQGNPWVHPSGNAIRPAPPPDQGRATPPHRPDVPCETQEPPNMNAPGGPTSAFASGGGGRRATARPEMRALERLGEDLQRAVDKDERDAREQRRREQRERRR